MGRREIDCVVVDLDLQHEKALNVALNKIQGDRDEEKPASLMAEFDADAFDVSLTGFDAAEVDALLNKFYSKESTQDDFDDGAEKKKIVDSQGASIPAPNTTSNPPPDSSAPKRLGRGKSQYTISPAAEL